MKRLILIMIIATIISTSAFADVYTIGSTSNVQYVNVWPRATVNITWTGENPYTGGVYAGTYNIIVDGVARDSFCIDLQDHAVGSPQTYNVTALEDAPDPSLGPMGEAKALALAELLYENWTAGMDAAHLAALQVAVWEVVADWDGSYDLTSGSFYTNGYNTTLAAGYLASIDGSGDYTQCFVGLSSDNYQDYVVRVPLPAAVLLGMLGLSVAGLKLRRFA